MPLLKPASIYTEMTTTETDGEIIMDTADYAEHGLSGTLTFGADMTVPMT